MTKRYHWLHQSQYLSTLSPACKMCAEGSKMVVLITGNCPAHCFYCPLSTKKQHKDVIYADEWQLENEEDVETLLAEAKAIDAHGAGITGGDPLMVPDRTIRYINFLKQHYGSTFHIHLYTSGLVNTQRIPDLIQAGLDEIRFHPEPTYWKKMNQSPLQKVIKQSVSTTAQVAIEIPAIPNMDQEIISLINWADKQKIDYINLNELEFSEQNEEALYTKGYTIKDDLSAAAKGSQETAYQVLTYFETQPVNIGIHYCSSSFKDGIQLTNRMKRRARNIATYHDVITDEGTILKGILEPNSSQTIKDLIHILKTLKLTTKEYYINQEKKRIELHPGILEENIELLRKHQINSYIIEEYPTKDQLEVERIPITKMN